MVYIKLSENLHRRIKEYLRKDNVLIIEGQAYLPYGIFKKVAVQNNLSIHEQVRRGDIIGNALIKTMVEETQKSREEKQFIEELKSKSERRMINKYRSNTNTNYYFQQNKKQSIKDLSSSLSFAMTFIFSFFLAGITGYYFAKYFLNLQFVQAMVIAVLFIMMTIIVQTILYIIKQGKNSKKVQNNKVENKKQKNEKKMKVDSVKKDQ